VEDADRSDRRWYPAPEVLLSTLFARRSNDAQRYDEIVVPFLNEVVTQFPVGGYPSNPPTPPLSDLLKGWTIVVRFGGHFERVYQSGNPNKILFLEFQGT
jgi:hypothetical protein